MAADLWLHQNSCEQHPNEGHAKEFAYGRGCSIFLDKKMINFHQTYDFYCLLIINKENYSIFISMIDLFLGLIIGNEKH